MSSRYDIETADFVELCEILDQAADWIHKGPPEFLDRDEFVVEMRRWAIRLLGIPANTSITSGSPT